MDTVALRIRPVWGRRLCLSVDAHGGRMSVPWCGSITAPRGCCGEQPGPGRGPSPREEAEQ